MKSFSRVLHRTGFLRKEKNFIISWKMKNDQFLVITSKSNFSNKEFLVRVCKTNLLYLHNYSFTFCIHSIDIALLLVPYLYCLSAAFCIHSIYIALSLVPYYNCIVHTVILPYQQRFIISLFIAFQISFCILIVSNLRQLKKVFRSVRVEKVFRYFLQLSCAQERLEKGEKF